MTRETKLEPCPFCGKEPLNKTIPPFNYSIGCGCGAKGPSDSNEGEAIAAWNRRPSPADDLTGLVERLRDWTPAVRSLPSVALADLIDEAADAIEALGGVK